MHIREYMQYDVHALAEAIKKGEISPAEALECARTRLHEVNPELNAVVMDCPEFANQCLEAMSGNEPFYGVPLLVKDLGHDLKGLPTVDGSAFFVNNVASETSDLVAGLISLGFVPFAKTNTPELGLSYVTESVLFGPCRNPYDLSRTSGGSSGGSAAAVAAGIAPIATASDGGGSIRIPAACCGLFGFKPTTGLTPTGPWTEELWSGMATNFVLTRSIRDATAVFNHLVKPAPLKTKKKSLIITCLDGVFAPVAVDPVCLEAVDFVKSKLEHMGHKIQNKHLSLDLEAIGACALTLIAANTFSVVKAQEQNMGREAYENELEPVTWEFYQRGSMLSVYDLIQAKNRLYQLMRPLHDFLQHTDIILSPALAQLPLLIGELNTADEFNQYLAKNVAFSPFTSLFNQAGLPAMSIPVMQQEHLPISVQMGAGKGKDLVLLSLAQELQTQLFL